MKKWLNVKPKVNDFSEDEVDTETESEDDGMRECEDNPLRTQGIQSLFSNQTSGLGRGFESAGGAGFERKGCSTPAVRRELAARLWIPVSEESPLRLVDPSLRTSEYRPINIFINFYSAGSDMLCTKESAI
ncbi:hypothetical protein OROGR_021274 [Orobanche gracilis]